MEMLQYILTWIVGLSLGMISSYFLFIYPQKKQQEISKTLRSNFPDLNDEEFDHLLNFYGELKDSIKKSKEEIKQKIKEIK